MKLYIAGPMTHIPQFNFPAFDAMARRLRKVVIAPGQHHEVVSPSELDDPAARAAAMASLDGDPEAYARLTGLSWGDFLARDVKLIADGGFDGIVTLPGWQRSRGARLETFVGRLSNVAILWADLTYDNRPLLNEHSDLALYRAWAQDERLVIP